MDQVGIIEGHNEVVKNSNITTKAWSRLLLFNVPCMNVKFERCFLPIMLLDFVEILLHFRMRKKV